MTISTPETIPALQIGSRLKLTAEQREQLKAAFIASTTAHSAPVEGRGISVATAVRSSVESELGLDRLTFSSLISSRESIALPLVLRLQRVLGVNLVSEKSLKDAFSSYVGYLKDAHGL
jgi:hypothetical protein